MATLTDSRFKDHFFGSNIAKASAKDILQEEIRKQESIASAEILTTEDRTKVPSPKRHENNSLLDGFYDIIGTSSAEIPTPTSELDCYPMEPVIDYKIGKPFA